MKKLLLFVAVMSLVVISACGTTKYRVQGDCAKITTEDLLKSITTVLVQNDFRVTLSDTKVGYLASETNKDCGGGLCTGYKWTFQHNDGKIFATWVWFVEQVNAFGTVTGSSETYVNDEKNEKWTKYWNVRRALEKLCGEKLVIVEMGK